MLPLCGLSVPLAAISCLRTVKYSTHAKATKLPVVFPILKTTVCD